MQQPLFRDVLWAVLELSDRGETDLETYAYQAVLDHYPDLTITRFEEVIEMLVLTDHLRRWDTPVNNPGRAGGGPTLMPTAKARLQFTPSGGE